MFSRRYVLTVQMPSGPAEFVLLLYLSPKGCSGTCEFRGNIVPIDTVLLKQKGRVALRGKAPISSGWFEYRVCMPVSEPSFEGVMEITGGESVRLHGKVA